MARREYYHSAQCVHEGCTERAHYVFSTRTEQRDTVQSLQRRGGWRCTRHRKPEEVLSTESPTREHVLVSKQLSCGRKPLGLFWCSPDAASGNAFAYGPGFKAFAEDFPEGTCLVITARVELPGSELTAAS